MISVVGIGPLCAALSGLCATLTLNPGLTPWAILLDPFGVPSFVTETSLSFDSLNSKLAILIDTMSEDTRITQTMLDTKRE